MAPAGLIISKRKGEECMKFKKLLALGITILCFISVLPGCGNTASENGGSQPQGTVEAQQETVESSEAQEDTAITFPLEEPVSFTGMAVMNQSYKLSESLSWKTMNERTNVNIELIAELQNAEAGEKMNLIMNGGDYPDMIIKPSGLDFYELGQQGVVIPLEDLIRQYAPNLTAALDERDLWDSLRTADGEIYTLPYLIGVSPYGGEAPLWINKRWLDNLGLEEPKNLDELYQVLKAFKEEDANGNGDPDDEIPFTFAVDLFTPNRFLAYMEDGLFYFNIYSGIVNDELVYYPLTDGFKDNYLAYLKKMYEEGIIDKNAFTQKYDQMSVNGKAADIHGMFFRSSPTGQVADEYVKDYVTIKPWSEGHLPMTEDTGAGMAITDKCKNPEILIAWADYFYSEEGSLLADLGVEGKTYRINDDGTYSWIVDGTYGDTAQEVQDSQCMKGTTGFPMLFYDFRYRINPDENPSLAWTYDQTFLSLYKMGTVMPKLQYTEEESDIISQYQTQIHSYIETYIAETVTGQADLESTYNEFQETLRNMGAEELFAVYQAAYERATAQ